jgi:hypothetical protein
MNLKSLRVTWLWLSLLLLPLLGQAQISPFPFQYDHIYEIRNRYSGKLLELAGGVIATGTPAQQWDKNGTAAQQWYIRNTGSATYQIINRSSNYYLNCDNSQAQTNGSPVTLQNRDSGWIVGSFNGGTSWVIRNLYGLALEINYPEVSNGASAQIWQYDPNALNQQWEIKDLSVYNIYPSSYFSPYPAPYPSPELQGVYTIKNENSQKLLEVSNSTSDNGEVVQQWSSMGLATQQWYFEEFGGGYLMPFICNKVRKASSTFSC